MEHHMRQRLERLQAREQTLVQAVKRKNTMIMAQGRRIRSLEEKVEELTRKLREMA